MAKVIERIFVSEYVFKDEPSTYENASKIVGKRLDRRGIITLLLEVKYVNLLRGQVLAQDVLAIVIIPALVAVNVGMDALNVAIPEKFGNQQWVPFYI